MKICTVLVETCFWGFILKINRYRNECPQPIFGKDKFQRKIFSRISNKNTLLSQSKNNLNENDI